MRHDKLANIAQGISGITQVIQDDLSRAGCEGGAPLDQYRLGCLMSAIEELSSQANEMSDEMAEEKEREWEAMS